MLKDLILKADSRNISFCDRFPKLFQSKLKSSLSLQVTKQAAASRDYYLSES